MPDKSQICTANNLKLNNATTYNVDVNALCAEEFSINTDTDGPKVLVVHTHTTECYDGDQMNGETERNTDASMNVVAVGDEICRVLEENGIRHNLSRLSIISRLLHKGVVNDRNTA